jgi:hypothetical protein
MIDFIYAKTPNELVSKINKINVGDNIINIIENNNGYIAFYKIENGRRE